MEDENVVLTWRVTLLLLFQLLICFYLLIVLFGLSFLLHFFLLFYCLVEQYTYIICCCCGLYAFLYVKKLINRCFEPTSNSWRPEDVTGTGISVTEVFQGRTPHRRHYWGLLKSTFFPLFCQTKAEVGNCWELWVGKKWIPKFSKVSDPKRQSKCTTKWLQTKASKKKKKEDASCANSKIKPHRDAVEWPQESR